MSNWYGAFRSNYFKVNNPKNFRLFFATIKLQYPEIGLWEEKGRFVFGGECALPGMLFDTEGNVIMENFAFEVVKYLQDDEILILQEAGNEKLCYITGFAIAINSKGESISMEISDIYDMASKKFKVPKDKIY